MPRVTIADLQNTVAKLKFELDECKALASDRAEKIKILTAEKKARDEKVLKLISDLEFLRKDFVRMEEENRQDKHAHKLRIQEIREDFQRQYNEQVQKLNIEYQEKVDALKPEKAHNERGAGRKPTLNEHMIQKIHDLRTQGLTQQEIADEIGMSKATVNRILKINYVPSDDSIINN